MREVMNIKGLLGPQVMPAIRPTEKVDRAIHSDVTHDRDANGQQTFGDSQDQREPMSDEQLQQALEHLRQLPAVKEHKWTVELSVEDDKKYVLIKDNLGTLIRRIPEIELWTLGSDQPLKGQIFKKTA